jgi:hypothetical protein
LPRGARISFRKLIRLLGVAIEGAIAGWVGENSWFSPFRIVRHRVAFVMGMVCGLTPTCGPPCLRAGSSAACARAMRQNAVRRFDRTRICYPSRGRERQVPSGPGHDGCGAIMLELV